MSTTGSAKNPDKTGRTGVDLDPDMVPVALKFMDLDNRPTWRNAVNTLLEYGALYAQKHRGFDLGVSERR